MYDSEDLAFELLKQSDAKAFEWLFKKHYRPLCLFANRYTNHLQVAEEIVAEAFAFLWDRRDVIFISASFKSYMYKTVQNRCLNYLRHKKIESTYVNYLVRNNLLDDQAFQEKQLNSYYDKELALEIQKAIDRLPEKCREIFKLSRFENLTYKQIAVQLSISPKTVENQVGIALDKLRQSLRHFLMAFFF